MKPGHNRAARLARLEHIQSIAKQAALTQVAQAERALAQVTLLSSRVDRLASAYANRSDARDGFALAEQSRFQQAIGHIAIEAFTNTRQARTFADEKRVELEGTEKRRSAAQDARMRAESAQKKAKAQPQAMPGRRVGTVLE